MTEVVSRRQHSPEFKEEALRLASKIGVAKASRELGVAPSRIYSWRASAQKQASRTKRESGLATENARLRRQLAEQAEELEILKKAAVDSIDQRNTHIKIWLVGGSLNETYIYRPRKRIYF